MPWDKFRAKKISVVFGVVIVLTCSVKYYKDTTDIQGNLAKPPSELEYILSRIHNSIISVFSSSITTILQCYYSNGLLQDHVQAQA